MTLFVLEGLSSGWLAGIASRSTASLLAYLDQGSGSYILQTLATGVFSLGYFMRRVLQRLTSPWNHKDG